MSKYKALAKKQRPPKADAAHFPGCVLGRMIENVEPLPRPALFIKRHPLWALTMFLTKSSKFLDKLEINKAGRPKALSCNRLNLPVLGLWPAGGEVAGFRHLKYSKNPQKSQQKNEKGLSKRQAPGWVLLFCFGFSL